MSIFAVFGSGELNDTVEKFTIGEMKEALDKLAVMSGVDQQLTTGNLRDGLVALRSGAAETALREAANESIPKVIAALIEWTEERIEKAKRGVS